MRGRPLSRRPGGAYPIEGTASSRDLRRQAGLPLEESQKDQTVAGVLIHVLHAARRPGAAVVAQGFVWRVVDMEGPRIAKVKAERRAAGAPGAGAAPG